MKTTTLKVMAIDSDTRFLEAYPYYFSTYREYSLAGIYPSVSGALEDYEEVRPDIILSEVHLPGGSGINGIAEFRKRTPQAKILMVSNENGFEYIKNSFKLVAVITFVL